MPDELSIEDVRKVARLARLAVSDADAERYRAELAAVLGYIERLGEVDVAGVEPMAHVADAVNMLRDDEPGAAFDPSVVEKLAPEAADGFIRVPKVLGEGGGA
ncbi:MAG: Asp-tRNA(Asn)/Glu-tRNA(Gln) amidotransferase subunit GatC [Phycisphaerales bacterium]